jgi:pseudoazurin
MWQLLFATSEEALVKLIPIIFVLSAIMCTRSIAASLSVEMLNGKNGEAFVYSDKLLRVKSNDIVTWKSTNPGHNAEFIAQGYPAGAADMHGKISKDVSYAFEVPGIYVVKCTPHFGLGMIQVIVVDDNLNNLDQVRKLTFPGKSKSVAESIFAQISK